MRDKTRIIYIIGLVLIFLVYIYFSYSSGKKLSIDEKYRFLGLNRENIYGFYGNEESENGLEYNWMGSKEALKRIRIEEAKIIIPVFCLKPDIDENPVRVEIFFNDRMVDEVTIVDNDVRYLEYNVVDLGYEIGKVLEIEFKVNSLWSPSEYNLSEDTRKLGIGVGNIEFVK